MPSDTVYRPDHRKYDRLGLPRMLEVAVTMPGKWVQFLKAPDERYAKGQMRVARAFRQSLIEFFWHDIAKILPEGKTIRFRQEGIYLEMGVFDCTEEEQEEMLDGVLPAIKRALQK